LKKPADFIKVATSIDFLWLPSWFAKKMRWPVGTGFLYKHFITLLRLSLFKVFKINSADRKKAKIYDAFYPIFTTSVQGDGFQFYCPNAKVFKRYESFLRKEPETIEWIGAFSAGETLFDIGANIGLYSLLAAKRGIRVFAFEPESQNFGVMVSNIYLNSLEDCLTALNIALSDQNTLDYLYMPVFSTGTAYNQFGVKPGIGASKKRNGFQQAVISYTVDAFIETYSKIVPTHIKIDVDGIESKILAGASRTLANPEVHSMLVELDDNRTEDQEAISDILSKGFKIASQTPKGDTGVYNFIFIR
jgi:FkbM family methyltransferase